MIQTGDAPKAGNPDPTQKYETEDPPATKVDSVATSSPAKNNAQEQKFRREIGAKQGWDNAAVVCDVHGEAEDVLVLREYREKFERRSPFEVVVRVEASTVSRMDCEIRRNIFLHSVDVPFATGCDIIGTVVLGGSGADLYGVKTGDRVCSIGLRLGGNSRYVVVPSFNLIHVPRDLDVWKAVCLPRTYVTAYQCLHRAGGKGIREGDRVLVTGGGGCIGRAVTQLAMAGGAMATYSAGGRLEGKRSRMLGHMWSIWLGRQPSEWLPVVEGDMDIVIDSVGADGYRASYRALNSSGKLVCIGDMSYEQDPKKSVLSSLLGQHAATCIARDANMMKASYLMKRTTYYDLFSEFANRPKNYKDDLQHLFRMLRSGSIQPVIAKCVPLHKVARAHIDIEEGGMEGTIVCLPFGFDGPDKPIERALSNTNAEENITQESQDEGCCAVSKKSFAKRDASTGSHSASTVKQSNEKRLVQHVYFAEDMTIATAETASPDMVYDNSAASSQLACLPFGFDGPDKLIERALGNMNAEENITEERQDKECCAVSKESFATRDASTGFHSASMVKQMSEKGLVQHAFSAEDMTIVTTETAFSDMVYDNSTASSQHAVGVAGPVLRRRSRCPSKHPLVVNSRELAINEMTVKKGLRRKKKEANTCRIFYAPVIN